MLVEIQKVDATRLRHWGLKFRIMLLSKMIESVDQLASQESDVRKQKKLEPERSWYQVKLLLAMGEELRLRRILQFGLSREENPALVAAPVKSGSMKIDVGSVKNEYGS